MNDGVKSGFASDRERCRVIHRVGGTYRALEADYMTTKGQQQMRILIAGDDPESRMILQKHVEREGHVCFLAASGEEAWVLFQANVVDGIISNRSCLA